MMGTTATIWLHSTSVILTALLPSWFLLIKTSFAFEGESSFLRTSVASSQDIENHNRNSIWTQIGNDIDPTGSKGDGCGFAVDLSSNGQYVIVGCPFANSGGGIVQLFRLNNVDSVYWWEGSQILWGWSDNDNFGTSCSFASSQNIFAVGVPGLDFDDSLVDLGTVLVFNGGSPPLGENRNDQFGYSIDLSDDGNTIAVAARNGEYVDLWRLKGNNNVQDLHLTTDDIVNDVCLSGDGGKIGYSKRKGGAELYRLEGISNPPLLVYTDNESRKISISDNGKIIAVGHSGFACGDGSKCGRVKVFDVSRAGHPIQIGNDIRGSKFDKCGSALDVSSDGQAVVIACMNKALVAHWSREANEWEVDTIPFHNLGNSDIDSQGVAISSSSSAQTVVALGSSLTNIVRIFAKEKKAPSAAPSPSPSPLTWSQPNSSPESMLTSNSLSEAPAPTTLCKEKKLVTKESKKKKSKKCRLRRKK